MFALLTNLNAVSAAWCIAWLVVSVRIIIWAPLAHTTCVSQQKRKEKTKIRKQWLIGLEQVLQVVMLFKGELPLAGW
jgi:hypothetical protein